MIVLVQVLILGEIVVALIVEDQDPVDPDSVQEEVALVQDLEGYSNYTFIV